MKKEQSIGMIGTFKYIGKAMLCAAIAAVLGRAALPFGSMPLALALVCSSSVYTLAAFAGALLSSIGMPPSTAVPLLCTYAVAILLRLIFSLAMRDASSKKLLPHVFDEPVYLRAVAAAVAAFALGAYRLAIGGFLYYDLFGMLISMGVASVGTVLLAPLSGTVKLKRARTFKIWNDMGYIVLWAATVFSLRKYSPLGVSLSVLVCMLVTLYSTKKRGLSFGILVAIASGLCVSVVYAPLFVFAAVCYGFLSSVSSTLGCFCAFLAGMSWGIYMNGVAAFLSLFSALLTATLLFLVTERLFFQNTRSKGEKASAQQEMSKVEKVVSDGSDIAVARLDDSARRMKELCRSLSDLSESLLGGAKKVSESKTPIGNSSVLYAEIGDGDVVVKKSSVRSNGKLREGKERNFAPDDIAELSLCTASNERGEGFALDLAAISDYIADIMAGNDNDYQPENELANEIGEYLREKLRIPSLRVNVFGGRRRRILVCCDDAVRLRAASARIVKELGKRFDLLLEAREPFEIGGCAYAVFERKAILRVSFAQRKRNAAGQTICGDSIGTVIDDDGGRAYAFISDGMGSGEKAARISELCAAFLEKLLPINDGNFESIRSTLSVINGFIRRQNGSSADECCATVDLGVFDLVDTKVSFYKSGAAPTFVFRDGSLFKLRTRSVPIGIIREPDFGRVNMELLPGDVLVMVSDGITDGREESPELFELLRSRLLTHSAEQLADAVIAYADKIGCTDDVSVIVAKVDDCLLEEKAS